MRARTRPLSHDASHPRDARPKALMQIPSPVGTNSHAQHPAPCSRACPTYSSPLTPCPTPTGKQLPGTTNPRPITPPQPATRHRNRHPGPSPWKTDPAQDMSQTHPRGIADVKQRHHLPIPEPAGIPPTRWARKPPVACIPNPISRHLAHQCLNPRTGFPSP